MCMVKLAGIAERNPAYLQVSYHYDPAGRLLNRILSNAARTDYSYDADNRLVSLANVSAGDKLSRSQTYTRDRLGNITTITDGSGTANFTYDALYRLINADYPGTADDKAYTYDGVGNRLTMTDAAGTLHYIYNNAGNRLDEVRSGSDTGPVVYSYAYDDAGNRIEKRDGSGALLQNCTYDQKNRIATLDSGGSILVFEYDPNDYRIAKDYGTGANQYLMEGEHYEAIYDAAGAIRAKFLRGVVVDEIVNGYYYAQGAKTNYTFHHDQLQSVVGLSGHNGDVEQTVAYGPFGEQLSTTGGSPNMLGYTGRELDSENGLYYYRARYYDPEIGRFLNEDPKGFGAGINFYAYCANNPINFNDPDGLEPNQFLYKTPQQAAIGASIEIIGKPDSTKFEYGGWIYSNLQKPPSYAYTEMISQGNHTAVEYGPEIIPQQYRVYSANPQGIHSHPLGVEAQFSIDKDIPQAQNFAQIYKDKGVPGPYTEYLYSFESDSLQQLTIAKPGQTPSIKTIWPSIPSVGGTGSYSNDSAWAGSASDFWASDTFGLSGSYGGASGGYVLYPNKPNTNMMRVVYAK